MSDERDGKIAARLSRWAEAEAEPLADAETQLGHLESTLEPVTLEPVALEEPHAATGTFVHAALVPSPAAPLELIVTKHGVP